MIDLRSDTVTRPDEEMRRAMYAAEVGDDVYGEDPTVRRLEEEVAGLLGKEAGVFVPSGTMANQIAVLVHTRRGDEVVVEAEAHIYMYEVGALGALGGVQARPVPGMRGLISLPALREAIRPAELHLPPTTLLCLENTHNRAGGAVLPREPADALMREAHRHGLRVHVDGARLLNAAVALGVPPHVLVAEADTASLCLSKGLGAPVGSVLCGRKEDIQRARKLRKMLGGGMRQAGVLAAAGLVALKYWPRLEEDHRRAARLADLVEEAGYAVERPVETNMVMVRVPDARVWTERLRAEGVLAGAMGEGRVRLVTHRDLTDRDIEEAGRVFRRLGKAP